MDTRFSRFVLNYPGRLAMPIGAYAGLEITGETIQDVVSVPGSQFNAIVALHDRYQTPVLLTAMDLSAEAETFGCEIRMPEREIPTVVGRLVANANEIASLPDPVPGDARTRVPIETAWRLVAEAEQGMPVLGCMIGPFSLAARLYGVSEAVEATALEPETMEELVHRVTGFLCQYALAFCETGAWGVIVAEPEAGLLSPELLGRFSAPFIKRIVEVAESPEFAVILHNCNAKISHLEKTLESGAGIYHFGAPMDIVAALERVSGMAGTGTEGGGVLGTNGGGAAGESAKGSAKGSAAGMNGAKGKDASATNGAGAAWASGAGLILGGNLDPTALFLRGKPEAVGEATRALLASTKYYKNFILSSGCDIPPGTPLANLNAFYRAVADFNK